MDQPQTFTYEGYRDLAQSHAEAPLDEKRHLAEAWLAAAPERWDFLYLACADSWARSGMGNPARPREIAEFAVALLERGLTEGVATGRRDDILNNLSYLCNEVGRFADAEAYGRACKSANAVYHFWLSEALFEQRKYLDDPDCVINLEAFADAAIDALQPAVTNTPVAPANGTVFLCSGDSVYFRRFVIPEALSLAAHNRDIAIHLHVFDPDPGTEPLMRKLAQRLHPIPVTATTEQVPIADIHSKRSYFAFARYLRAQHLFESTGRRVVVTDADLLFRADPMALVAQTEGYDAGIVRFEGQPLANRYNASFVVFNRTPAARWILKLVESFLRSQRNRPLIWILDQISLYCSMVRLEEMGRARVHLFHEDTITIHHKPDAPIWNGATNRKWGNSPYDELRRRILLDNGFSLDECDA